MFLEPRDVAALREVATVIERTELYLRVDLTNDLCDPTTIAFIVRKVCLLAATNSPVSEVDHQLAISDAERRHHYCRCKLAFAALAMSSSIRSQMNRIFRPPNGRR